MENGQAFQPINPIFLLCAWEARPGDGKDKFMLTEVAGTKGNIS